MNSTSCSPAAAAPGCSLLLPSCCSGCWVRGVYAGPAASSCCDSACVVLPRSARDSSRWLPAARAAPSVLPPGAARPACPPRWWCASARGHRCSCPACPARTAAGRLSGRGRRNRAGCSVLPPLPPRGCWVLHPCIEAAAGRAAGMGSSRPRRRAPAANLQRPAAAVLPTPARPGSLQGWWAGVHLSCLNLDCQQHAWGSLPPRLKSAQQRCAPIPPG